ncbi:hypothetical protein [Streptomyces sp. NPDC057582]|uniref:hypothetical protein n=1 Tax=Streptomyces sp. NPDC057582 TaxID=3346174 RepID=UPI0036CC8282
MTCPTTASAQSIRAAAQVASWVGEMRLLVDAQVIGSLKKKRTHAVSALFSKCSWDWGAQAPARDGGAETSWEASSKPLASRATA